MKSPRACFPPLVLAAALALLVSLAGFADSAGTEIASVSSGEVSANGESVFPAISADGRFVVFRSLASNLFSPDTNDVADIFIRDRQDGTTELVSLSVSGSQANRASHGYSVSADGRFVAFTSEANNLVANDVNQAMDVFVRDRQANVTERVSLSVDDVEAGGRSDAVAISGDGRYVAFRSSASNLVANDTNGAVDIFVRDRQAGSTERASISDTELEGNGTADFPAISGDGRFVVFTSSATNLVAGDSNGRADLFIRDRDAGTTERVSLGPNGAQANGDSYLPAISPDGRFVAFGSNASDLVAGDTNNASDVFLRDREAQTTERISLSSAGVQGDSASDYPAVSADGRFVAFESGAGNLAAGDTNGTYDVFLRDRRRGATRRASLSTQDAEGNGFSRYPTLSANGRFVAFQSAARNLTAGDANGWGDVFVRTAATPPAAPSNLRAAVVSGTQVDLTWSDTSADENGFEIERKTGDGEFTVIGAVGANLVQFSDPGLAANTAYTYRVRATNSGGESDYSNTVTPSTSADPPSAPTGLSVTPLSASRLELAWVDNSTGETGFRVERKPTGGAFSEVALVSANVTTFVDTGLTANSAYAYRVRSTNAKGDSQYSNEATASTLPNPPAAPTELKVASASQTELSLSWKDNSASETGFKIERKSGSGGFAEIATAVKDATSFIDGSLTADTAYTYRVRATNTGGDSAYTNEASGTPLPPAPSAPTDLTVEALPRNRIELAWKDKSDNETGFKIERKTGTGSFRQVASVVADTEGFVDLGLTANTAYTYRVRATNTGGDSAYSNEASNQGPNPDPDPDPNPAGPPAAPTGLAVGGAEQTKLTLTWTDASTDETGFKIERKTGSAAFAQVGTTAANVATFTDTGLAANTAYKYRVRATNAKGNSAYTAEAEGTTLAQPTPAGAPAAPTELKAAVVSTTQVTLTWKDNSDNEAEFKIERRTGCSRRWRRRRAPRGGRPLWCATSF